MVIDNEEMWGVFHKLWSRDVGREGYEKNDWKELEKLILKAIDKRWLLRCEQAVKEMAAQFCSPTVTPEEFVMMTLGEPLPKKEGRATR